MGNRDQAKETRIEQVSMLKHFITTLKTHKDLKTILANVFPKFNDRMPK